MNQQDMMIAQQMLSSGRSGNGPYSFVMAFICVSAFAAAPLILIAKVFKILCDKKSKRVSAKRNPYESLRRTGSLGVYSRYTSVKYSLPKPPRFDGLPVRRYN